MIKPLLVGLAFSTLLLASCTATVNPGPVVVTDDTRVYYRDRPYPYSRHYYNRRNCAYDRRDRHWVCR